MKKERSNKDDKNNQDHLTSISTPLGHIKVDSEVMDVSLLDWAKSVISKDDKEE